MKYEVIVHYLDEKDNVLFSRSVYQAKTKRECTHFCKVFQDNFPMIRTEVQKVSEQRTRDHQE